MSPLSRALWALALVAAVLASCAAAAAPSASPTTSSYGAPPHLHRGDTEILTFNLSYTLKLPPQQAYEQVHLLAALGGLANRAGPTLYVYYLPADDMWMQYFEQPQPQPRPDVWAGRTGAETGGAAWPEVASATKRAVPSIEALLAEPALAKVFSGVVLYDTAVPATSNVASTAAGVEGLLPIPSRPGDPASLYERLVAGGPKLPVKRSLVGMFNGSVTGSAKNDAYRWAITEYLTPPAPGQRTRADPSALGYFVDWFWTTVSGKSASYADNTVSNQDYIISRGGFVFDLSSWSDEAPNDDPNQPLGTDLQTLLLMLGAAYEATGGEEMLLITGFTPWAFKYVDAKHGGVPTEWHTSEIVTAFNAFVSADACCVGGMANAAFYAHFPLDARIGALQNRAPTEASLAAKGLWDPTSRTVAARDLAAFYVGDYDSAAWPYSQLHAKFDDAARGSVPLGWALDPNTALRAPMVLDYVFRNLSPTDRVTTGDSGAGYVNPTQLLAPRKWSNYSSAAHVWAQWNKRWFRQFGMSFTGFLIQGDAGPITPAALDMYVPFSWDGGTLQTGDSPVQDDPSLHNGTFPVFQEWDIPGGNVAQAAQTITSHVAAKHKSGAPSFSVFRSVLQTASYHKQVVAAVQQANSNIVFVEPLELAYLTRVHLGGNNDDRVAYVSDTLPSAAAAGAMIAASNVTVRNNGWNQLACTTAAGASRVQLVVDIVDASGATVSSAVGASAQDVPPGTDGVLVVTGLVAPATPGDYVLSYELQRGPNAEGRFSERGSIAWESPFSVTS